MFPRKPFLGYLVVDELPAGLLIDERIAFVITLADQAGRVTIKKSAGTGIPGFICYNVAWPVPFRICQDLSATGALTVR